MFHKIQKRRDMNRAGFVLITVFVFFSCSARGTAETLYLKNGKTVQGTVTEKTDSSITLDVDGVSARYAFDEVDSIVKDPLPAAEVKASEEPLKPKWVVYNNQEFGFKVLLPYGWFEWPRVSTQHEIFLEVNRSRTSTEEVPALSLSVRSFSKENEGDENVKVLSEKLQKALEVSYRDDQWKISEAPHEVEVGTEVGTCIGVDFAILSVGPGREPLKNIKMVCYAVILKDRNTMLIIYLFAHNDERLEKELREMEPLISSFSMIF
jgi:hypothetical protein